jgi:hypothetical protein
VSVRQTLQLLDECREAHAEVDRIEGAGRFSQFAVTQAGEAEERLLAAIEELIANFLNKSKGQKT